MHGARETERNLKQGEARKKEKRNANRRRKQRRRRGSFGGAIARRALVRVRGESAAGILRRGGRTTGDGVAKHTYTRLALGEWARVL